MRFSEYCKLEEQFNITSNRRLGSNPGGTYTHSPSGDKYYVKFPYDPEQAHVEVATADLYNAMGIRTLNPKIVNIDGKTGVAAKWQDHVKSFQHPIEYSYAIKNKDRMHELAKMHHAAILTGNRDIVGMDYTNVMSDQHTGELVSADQGGSMHFRAQGAKKPFEGEIGDVDSFQNPRFESGQVFSQVPYVSLKAAATHLNGVTDDVIDGIISKHNLSKETATVIKQRRDLLLKRFA
jgi:hypothetical protein